LDEFNKCGELKDMRFHLGFAALAATTAFAAPAAAQSAPKIKAEALLIQPATLQAQTNLNFGTIVATPASSGTVTVTPAGVRTISAVTSSLTAGPGAASRGRFIGNGNPNGNVALDVVFPAYLENTSDNTKTLTFSGSLDADAADNAITIGATGVFYIDVGGQITIAPNQMPGLYSGDVVITATFQ
jgi:hypothetical protein